MQWGYGLVGGWGSMGRQAVLAAWGRLHNPPEALHVAVLCAYSCNHCVCRILFLAATVYGKDADSWAADNIGSTNTQDQQYAVQLQNKEGYRTCELRFILGAVETHPGCLTLVVVV